MIQREGKAWLERQIAEFYRLSPWKFEIETELRPKQKKTKRGRDQLVEIKSLDAMNPNDFRFFYDPIESTIDRIDREEYLKQRLLSVKYELYEYVRDGGWKQRELAAQFRVAQSTISEWIVDIKKVLKEYIDGDKQLKERPGWYKGYHSINLIGPQNPGDKVYLRHKAEKRTAWLAAYGIKK